MRYLIVLASLLSGLSANAGIIRQNVRHFSKQGSTGLIGDVTISEGSNITLTQVGQNITITATASGGSVLSRATKTANYTITNSDDVIFADTSTGPFTLTLQTSASATSKMYWIDNIGQNSLTVTASGSDTFAGATTQWLDPGAVFIVFPDGGTTWYNFAQ